MVVAGDGDRAIDERADEGPDEPRHRLRPAAHDLQTERYAVDIRAVVRDDAQRQHDEAELAEAAEWREKYRREQASDAGCLVASRVRGRGD